MVYSPLAVGLLSGAYSPGREPPAGSLWGRMEWGLFDTATSGDDAAVLETVRGIAAGRGKTVAQVALNWVLSHLEVTVAISGSDTGEQIDDNLGAVRWELTAEEPARLDEVSSARRRWEQPGPV